MNLQMNVNLVRHGNIYEAYVDLDGTSDLDEPLLAHSISPNQAIAEAIALYLLATKQVSVSVNGRPLTEDDLDNFIQGEDVEKVLTWH